MSIERDDLIVKTYNDNKSLQGVREYIKEVCKQELSRVRIRQILIKRGVQLRDRLESIPKADIPKDKLSKLFGAGLSISEIAKDLGYGRSTIEAYIDKYGLTRSNDKQVYARRRKPGTKILTKDVLKKLIVEGLSQSEIAEKHDTQQSNISRLVRSYNIYEELKDERQRSQNENDTSP